CEIRILAEQPGADFDQAGGCPAASGGRVSLDPLWRQRRLELGTSVRHHIAPGVLGAHRAGLWAHILVLQEQLECWPNGDGGGGTDSGDAGALNGQDASRPAEGDAARNGLVVQPEARPRYRRLASHARRRASTAFNPPNAKELEIAYSTCATRA